MENVQDRQTVYAMYRPQKRYLTLTEKRYFSNVFNKISFFFVPADEIPCPAGIEERLQGRHHFFDN